MAVAVVVALVKTEVGRWYSLWLFVIWERSFNPTLSMSISDVLVFDQAPTCPLVAGVA